MPISGGGGGGGSSDAIRAGGAYLEISANDDKFNRALKRAEERLNKFGSAIAGIGLKLAGVGTALALPLLAAADAFRDMGDSLNDMADRTGITTEALSELGHAANLSGIDLDTLEAAIARMQASLSKVDEEAEFAGPAFEKLGLAFADLEAMDPEQQFLTIADAISKIEDPTKKAGLAMQVFGKTGKQLLPLFADGAEGIAEMREEAKQLGLSFSTDAAKGAAKLDDGMVKLKSVLGAIVVTIGSALAPLLTDLLEHLKNGAANVREFLAENKALVLIVAGVSAGLLGFGGVMITVGLGIKAIAFAIGGLSLAYTALKVIAIAAYGAILSPIAGIVAALGFLGFTWLNLTESGRNFAENVGSAFEDLSDTAVTAWGGITAAIASGDLAAAGEVAMLGLKAVWARIVMSMTQIWNSFKENVLDTFRDATAGAKMMLASFGSFVERNLGLEDPEVSRLKRDGVNQALMIARLQQQAESDRARADDVLAAEAEFRDAQQRLAEMVGNVVAANNKAEQKKDDVAKGVAGSYEKKVAQLADSTKGIFAGNTPNFAQIFAVGDSVQQKQLDVQKDILKQEKKTTKAMEDVGKQLKFK